MVDNASTEHNFEILTTEFPEILSIRSEANIGFAAANNLGFRYARGTYVLLLNPDTELFEPTINILMRHIGQLPDAGVVGCKL